METHCDALVSSINVSINTEGYGRMLPGYNLAVAALLCNTPRYLTLC